MRLIRFLVATWAVIGTVLQAPAAGSVIENVGNNFVSHLPSGWSSTRGGWEYFDVAACFSDPVGDCYGNNPASPYGYPTFPTPSGSSNSFQLNQNEAVVIFLKTPPSSRYFGFTQYLFQRGATQLFASLSDTLNQKQFVTFSSPAPGQNVFNNFAVIVWTADLNVLASVKRVLLRQGILSSQINFIPLPISLPVFMGYGDQYDFFLMLMRTALPDVQSEMDAYIANLPFYVVKVGPTISTPINPAPTIGYKSDISGVIESASYQSAIDSLVADVKTNYDAQYVFRNLVVTTSTKVGWDCIAGRAVCAGDNHDSLYSLNTQRPVTPLYMSDLVFVIGVNHQKTGKAAYINHSVYDTVHNGGVASVTDVDLSLRTALYHAGISSPTDPRVQLYKNLYVYAVSYDCAGVKYCLQIPVPTNTNPVGIAPGAPFRFVSRSYLEPNTLVRPSASEILPHKVFVATHR